MATAGPPMILPKGIVINTKHVYNDVAGYALLPTDKVWEYWHVYTTTNKKLKDPTARRLENFWWHVLGSDRRFLRGRTLARLYEDISLGPTFVPLRGPPNRWEGPEVSSQPIPEQPVPQENGRVPSPRSGSSAKTPLKNLSSSASKPPPSHPILKKASGLSSTGPRPTARFAGPSGIVSPHDEKDDAFPSDNSVTTTNSELRIASASPAKKKHPASKKFVAAGSAAKRRPVLSRRTSSQASLATDSTSLSRETLSSNGSRSSLRQRAVSPIPEALSSQVSPSSEGTSVSSNQQPLPGPSAKALGKRPAVPRKAAQEARSTAKPSRHLQFSPREDTSVSSDFSSRLASAQSLVDLPRHSRTKSELARPSSGVDLSSTLGRDEAAPMMARSQSHTGQERIRGGSIGRPISQGLFTGATASMTNVAAQGTIIDQSGFGSLPMQSILSQEYMPETATLPSRPSATSLLESRFTPTQPSTSASVPLGRTRSSLTLLLERDKDRSGNRSKPKS